MPDLLLELLSEEIPARMQRKAASELRAAVTNGLVDAGLTYEGAKEYWTPRRLVLDVRGLTSRSADIREERKGPRTDAPEKAIAGFLRGAGLSSIEEAEVRNDPKKGDFYVAVVEKPGRDATEIIAEIMPGIIKGFPWPKSMRWGVASEETGSLKWVRPLQSILCLFGPETEEMDVVSFEVDGLSSGNTTCGHRFMAADAFVVKHFDDYASRLEKAFVMLDAEMRKETILAEAKNLAFAKGLELVDDNSLLEEVSGLVEWPVVLMGEFGREFLDIPSEVIQLTIRENQKCFVTRSSGTDALTNNFLLVSNIVASDGGVEVARGNAKVVNARLSDAKFFWESDLHQINSEEGFGPWIDKLNAVTFHAKLGTQGERVARIVALAEELAPVVGADAENAKEAARFCKADLNSAMVYEFPEVQGKIGRVYADRTGRNPSVALAIQEHYSPLGPADNVPDDPVSVTVAMADKLDTLVGFWAIDEKPTGSKDPYALRRSALGVIRLIVDNEIRVSLHRVFQSGFQLFRIQHGQDFGVENSADLLSFFHDRLKVYLKDQGIRHDWIDAVLDEGSDDLLIVYSKAEALRKLIDSEDGQNLLAGYKRAANILAAEEKKGTAVAATVSEELFKVEAEAELNVAIDKTVECNEVAISNENFEGAMKSLASLRAPVDRFFEEVLVNDEDEAIRANRLALLDRIRSATSTVADFSKISG
ncbi:MAG: glycine--tRNA ligase subunit beta [Pseudomonadota bacterium]